MDKYSLVEYESANPVVLSEELMSGIEFFTKRDILSTLNLGKRGDDALAALGCRQMVPLQGDYSWLRIGQVGKIVEFNSRQYYSAIQKVLLSCHSSEERQLAFLIQGDGEKINLYLGIKSDYNENLGESLAAFINVLLPGTKAECKTEFDQAVSCVSDNIINKNYKKMYAFTGIPSLMGNNGDEILNAIDMFVGPLSNKKFAYLVIARPMDEFSVNKILTTCIDYAGKVESIKNVGINQSANSSKSTGKSHFSSSSSNVSHGTNKKSFYGKLITAVGLGFGMDLGSLVDTHTESIGQTSSSGESSNTNESRGESFGRSMNVVNKYAELGAERLNKHIQRYKQGLGLGMWETGVYLLLEEETGTALSSAMQLKSIVSGKETSLEPIRIHDLSFILSDAAQRGSTSYHAKNAITKFEIPDFYLENNNRQAIKNIFDDSSMNLTTYLNTEELSCFINLPQRDIPGVSIVNYHSGFSLTPQSVKGEEQYINIGKLMYSGSQSNIGVRLPIDTLCRHALVAGVNGSGKTNTVFSIIEGFMRKHRPFLVLEPCKTEYIDWAIEYNKRIDDSRQPIRIFVPGCNNYKGYLPEVLRLNPFEVINLGQNELRVLSHIDRLKAIFATAFPMQDILPVIMESLLYQLYDEAHMIDTADKLYMKKGFPQLKNVNTDFIKDLMRNIGYAQENTQNISAALRTRFQSMKFGWKGEMLDNPKLTNMTWGDLFGSPCVINLSFAGDDQDRAFIMALLLQFLYEYRIAEMESVNTTFNDNICRHLVIVEEAHRVMGASHNPESPQYKSGLMFSNFLSEVRAYGQGMMVVDQVPTRLIEDAVKNTNIKIIHKLVAADDSKRIAESIGLLPGQEEVIAKLSVGQAVLAGFNSANVMSNDSSAVYLAQIAKKK